ncbi:hypothetical protein [uncultured Shimia sp.]|uniref:hypothetical protein n=1 Tax=uncultured Shimia sp. TaxID=573152 RepID=UPI0026368FFA|nr:hypothetical protein [uncultured Shimia sp.]
MTKDLIAPLAILVAGAIMLSGTMLNHDTSWYLISTGWWLDGLPIYEEILELNPPWSFYLAAPPVWAAKTLGISATTSFQIYTLALIVASIWMAGHILRGDASIPDLTRRIWLAAAAAALVWVPMKDFAEREHLFAIFYLPFVAMSMSSTQRTRRQRGWISLWATLGVALKHYFVLMPLLLLIYRLIAERSWRPILRIETLLPAALLIGYVGASWVVHPAYFDKIIPLTLAVYGTSSLPIDILLGKAAPVLFLFLWPLIMAGLVHPDRRAALVAVLTALGGILVFFIQAKGWSYHRVPADVYTVLALVWVGTSLARTRQHWMPAALAVLGSLSILVPAIASGPYDISFAQKVERHFACAPGERSFQAFSSVVSSGYPLANYAQATPSNRAPTLWLIPGATYNLSQATDDARSKYEEILAYAKDTVLADFFRARPQLVLVDVSKEKFYFGDIDFDYIDFFSEDDAFLEAWRDYQQVGQVGDFEIYHRPGC